MFGMAQTEQLGKALGKAAEEFALIMYRAAAIAGMAVKGDPVDVIAESAVDIAERVHLRVQDLKAARAAEAKKEKEKS